MPPAKRAPAKATPTAGRWERKDATRAALTRFEQDFDKQMGFAPVASSEIEPYPVLSTGILSLDVALKTGGLVEGRVNEIWGPEHVGKSTVCMLVVAQAQRQYPGRPAAWVDMEQTFDKRWAQQLGVDLKRLYLVENPKNGEEAADSYRRFVESGLFSIVVLDSIGSIIPKGDFDKEADEDVRLGGIARIVTRMVKQIAPMARSNGTATLLVNQVRAVVDGGPKGPKTQTTGGWALKHVTTAKIALRRGADEPKKIKVPGLQDPVVVSYSVAAKVEKLKVGPYGETAHFFLTNRATLEHGPVGVDQIDEAARFGVQAGVITRKTPTGGWYVLPDGQQVNGMPKVRAYLAEHPEMVKLIRETVIASLADQLVEEVPEPVDEGMEAILEEVL